MREIPHPFLSGGHTRTAAAFQCSPGPKSRCNPMITSLPDTVNRYAQQNPPEG